MTISPFDVEVKEDSVTVFGVYVLRPLRVAPADWQDFWHRAFERPDGHLPRRSGSWHAEQGHFDRHGNLIETTGYAQILGEKEDEDHYAPPHL